jgi:hypothetical protein
VFSKKITIFLVLVALVIPTSFASFSEQPFEECNSATSELECFQTVTPYGDCTWISDLQCQEGKTNLNYNSNGGICVANLIDPQIELANSKFECLEGSCGAECSEKSDCSPQGNIYEDSFFLCSYPTECTDSCGCEYTDESIWDGTDNCNGLETIPLDTYKCTEEGARSELYSLCIKDSCGATCSTNSDCGTYQYCSGCECIDGEKIIEDTEVIPDEPEDEDDDEDKEYKGRDDDPENNETEDTNTPKDDEPTNTRRSSSGGSTSRDDDEDCDPDWYTTSWSICLNGQQIREVMDLNHCEELFEEPDRVQTCVEQETSQQKISFQQGNCVENWKCSSWSVCTEGVEERLCEDLNKCGTTAKPNLEQQCSKESSNLFPAYFMIVIGLILGALGIIGKERFRWLLLISALFIFIAIVYVLI